MAKFVAEETKTFRKKCWRCHRTIEYTERDIRKEQCMNGGSPYTVWYVSCPDEACARKNGSIKHDLKDGHH